MTQQKFVSGQKGVEIKGDGPEGVFITPNQARAMLGLSMYMYEKLLKNGELKPVSLPNIKHRRYLLSDIQKLSVQLRRSVLGLPYDRFVMALAVSKNYTGVNEELGRVFLPPVTSDHYHRLKIVVGKQDFAKTVKDNGIEYFFKEGLGRAIDIVSRPDIRLVADCLHLIGKGEAEIAAVIKQKFNKEFDEKELLIYLNYFFNLAGMTDESMDHYLGLLPKREASIKKSAKRRFDYVVYYALGLDYPGDIGELIERSCLGLLYEFNNEIDGRVFEGNEKKGRIDTLKKYSEVIVDLFSAARDVRRESGGRPMVVQGGEEGGLTMKSRDDLFKEPEVDV